MVASAPGVRVVVPVTYVPTVAVAIVATALAPIPKLEAAFVLNVPYVIKLPKNSGNLLGYYRVIAD